ncbi:MAG: hypothetical protein ACXADH_06195 [Candidatus Kariarchaeaceae archaeon]
MVELKSSNENQNSQSVIREDTMYYDLGYRHSQHLGRKVNKAITRDFSLYLLLNSAILHLIFGIQQLITIIIISIFYSHQLFTQRENSRKISSFTLISILIATVVDHSRSDIIVEPGKFIHGELTILVWILELTWIIIFGVQAIITLQPYTPLFSQGKTVQPETTQSKEEFSKLQNQLTGTDFSLIDEQQLISTQSLQIVYQRIIINMVAFLVLIVLLDIALWRIVGSFGSGINILEEYFVSGIALILFTLLISFSSILFPDRDEFSEME